MPNTRPFRFGVATEGAPSREQWRALARQAEDLGYAALLLPDHFVTEFSPLIALMAAADATKTLRIGSFVCDNDFRHPALLAKMAITVDHASNGRLELGLGAGGFPPEHDTFGIAYPPTGERVSRFEESVALNPSFAQAHFALGCTKVWSGRAREGIADVERAAELSPRDPHLSSFYATRAFAHIRLGEYAEAVEYGRRATRVPNAKAWPYLMLISALGLMDRIEEARRVVAALLEKEPDYTLEVARSDFFFCADQAVVDRCLDGLRRAGLPGGD